jgi:hypothetical protein
VTNTTQDSTTCLHSSAQQTRVNAVGHGISYLMYDNEGVNGALMSPVIELRNPANYTDMGANLVHSFGYKYGVSPTGYDGGNCFDNSSGTCGLLWKELKKVHWANVDLLDLQFEFIPETSTTFVSDVQKVANWVYTNSSGHTSIMVQVLISDYSKITPAQMLPNLHAIKGLINGTNIECASTCNTTATETIFRGMMR